MASRPTPYRLRQSNNCLRQISAAPRLSRRQTLRTLLGTTTAQQDSTRLRQQCHQQQQQQQQQQQRQSFHSGNVRLASQEGELHKDNENRAEEAEKHKQEQLQKGLKEGKGQWKEELASEGERSIAADKNTTADPETLQKETQGEVAKKHGQK
ncbi:MAG: hypothetical protein M1831_003582 [Alyxoria varia]|nr:MAG: hypothetical protein M1831_003582 [Alyxoria varia]